MLNTGYILDGKYEVIKVIGKGGMGTVYLCKNNRLQNLWAIKEVKIDAQNQGVFLTEPEILKNLRHPGIPRVIDIFYENENLYMVEDYIEGETLESLVERTGPIDPEEVCRISMQLCDIIGYLHSLKPPIIYRDLKPSNIMITPNNSVMLVDFSISRIYKANKVEDTVFMGSRGFAAPEQYGGAQSNVQTDIYGLGATMYYMAVGNVPPSVSNLFSDEKSGIDSGLKNIIKKAMMPDIKNRYTSMQEVKEALSSYIQNRGGTVVFGGRGDETNYEKTCVMQRKTPAKPKRNIKKILAGVILFFIIIGCMQYFLLKDDKAVFGLNKDKKTEQSNGAESTSAPTSTPTPTPEATPTPTEVPDMTVQGIIYKNAPLVLKNSDKPKGKGKSKLDGADIFYRVNPEAAVGRYNDRFIIKIVFIEFKDEDAIVYCDIENNTGKDIGIVLKDTYLLNDSNEGIRLDGSGIFYIKDGTDKQEIKMPFQKFQFDTDIIKMKTSIVSKDGSLGDQIELIINVK